MKLMQKLPEELSDARSNMTAIHRPVLVQSIEPAEEQEWVWLSLLLRHAPNVTVLVAASLIVTTFYAGGLPNALCLSGLCLALVIDHLLSHKAGGQRTREFEALSN